jgi:hypothetical protein
LTITNCPTCSKPAIGTVDLIPGTARFTDFNESGEVDYEGWTDVRWDSQQTQEGPNELPLVTCGVHEWETKIEGN